jgi:hypothetical protein
VRSLPDAKVTLSLTAKAHKGAQRRTKAHQAKDKQNKRFGFAWRRKTRPARGLTCALVVIGKPVETDAGLRSSWLSRSRDLYTNQSDEYVMVGADARRTARCKKRFSFVRLGAPLRLMIIG